MPFSHSWLIVVALLPFAACGGDPFQSAPLESSPDAASGVDGASTANAADAHGDARADTSHPTDATPAQTPDANEDKVAPVMSSDAPEEEPVTTVDAIAPNPDTAAPAPRYIPCDSGFCRVGLEKCCVVYAPVPDFCVGGPDEPTDCASDQGSTGLFECDDGGDCANLGKPGTVCCGKNRTVTDYPMWEQVVCVPPDECSPTLDDVFCGSTDSGCPQGKTCTGNQDPYTICE